jgi:hypothetical protein
LKFFKYMRDGGPESKVTGFFFAEIKSLFSIVLLHFEHGSREAYHSHAFNAVSWVLKGQLEEHRLERDKVNLLPYVYTPSLKTIYTSRENIHQVRSTGDTWVLSFRGPWAASWLEYIPTVNKILMLSSGRKIAGEVQL